MYRNRPPVRVVVIEDNLPDVMLLRESLIAEQIEHQITHYKDGVEAIAHLCLLQEIPMAKRPDVIVIDLNMPRMGGLEVLATLKQTRGLADVPVAILTSSLCPDEQYRAERLGASRFLRKPIDLDEYLRDVGGMLRDLIPEHRTNPRSASAKVLAQQ